MKFIIASSNPVKVNAVRTAIAEHFVDAPVIGLEVPSGVNAQPMSDEETRAGARNRAQAARQQALEQKIILPDEEAVCVGLEGGVFHPDFALKESELWSTVWSAVLDEQGRCYTSNGARFPLPQFLADMLLAGQEMGTSLGAFVGDPDLRSKSGAIGYLTYNFTDRTSEYASVVQLALGLWYGARYGGIQDTDR